TTTTLPAPTPTTLPPPIVSATTEGGGFQGCTAVGAQCGPCGASGEMALCLRQIGKVTPVCTMPRTCAISACLWDSDCRTGQRCVQTPVTQSASCCEECTGVVLENQPRYVTLSTTSTSATIVRTSTSLGRRATTSTTAPAPQAEAGFLACAGVGAACGPCPPT